MPHTWLSLVPTYASKASAPICQKGIEKAKEELENVTAENNQPHVPTTHTMAVRETERKMKSILNETCQAGWNWLNWEWIAGKREGKEQRNTETDICALILRFRTWMAFYFRENWMENLVSLLKRKTLLTKFVNVSTSTLKQRKCILRKTPLSKLSIPSLTYTTLSTLKQIVSINRRSFDFISPQSNWTLKSI